MVSPSTANELCREQCTGHTTTQFQLDEVENASVSLVSSYGGLQTLRQVLNGCKQALQERQYDQRHNEVLKEIATYLGGHLSAADYQMVADLD